MGTAFKKILEKIKHALIWIFDRRFDGFLFGRFDRIVLFGEKWEIHLTDADPYPSIPHMHSYTNKRYKLDVYTGVVYNIVNHAEKGRLSKKEFELLWNTRKFVETVDVIRNEHIKEMANSKHTISLPEIPSVSKITLKNDDIFKQVDNGIIIDFTETGLNYFDEMFAPVE